MLDRNFDHITLNKAETLSALQNIINYFGEQYLTDHKSNRLQRLWKRTDSLATNELFILGKSLEKFKNENDIRWLKNTIRKIKKDKDDKHGFFTEIVFYGMFSFHDSQIEPAKGNNPGYDFSIKLPNDVRLLISIKNIGISNAYRKFRENCNKLRELWRQRLERDKKNLALTILSKKPLCNKDFYDLTKFISSDIHLVHKPDYIDNQIEISIGDIPYHKNKLCPYPASDTVVVCCPSPDPEKKRYAKKLLDAASNLKKNTKSDDKTLRIIFIKMHTSADYALIEDQINNLVIGKDFYQNDDGSFFVPKDSNSEVDGIICYQPSYVRNSKNKSLISHFIQPIINPKSAILMNGSDWFRFNPILGIPITSQDRLRLISTSPSNDNRPTITTFEEKITTSLAHSSYVFQRGDIYLWAEPQRDGELTATVGSPSVGVMKHSVHPAERDGKKGIEIISGKSFPIDDELTII